MMSYKPIYLSICRRATGRRSKTAAFTLIEVVVAVLLLGVITISLFAAFSSGLAVAEESREDLRATQILVQKLETLRLMTWSQTTNTSIVATNFTDWFDPAGTNSQRMGVQYRGVVLVETGPTNVPSAYRSDMRTVTVTVYWTNDVARSTNRIVRCRSAQTFVARYGMQNYIF